MGCAQQGFRVREFLCKPFAPRSPSSTKHSTYLHISAPKNKHQWSHKFIPVWIVKSPVLFQALGDILEKVRFKEQVTFPAIAPCKNTVNSAAILLLVTKLQHSVSPRR